MKNKKILIISIIVALLVIIAGIVTLILLQNTDGNGEEYNKAVKKYENLVYVSEQINSKIDEKLNYVTEFLSTNSDVGENKSNLEELNNTINQLKALKIEIDEKSKKTTELNASIEKMEKQIKEIDSELLESDILKGDNVTEEKPVIILSEDNAIDSMISNIDVLIEKVNDDVKAEADRKAKEEQQTLINNMLSGDFKYIEGTYTEVMYGIGATLTIKADGTVTMNDSGASVNYKITSVKKQNNGSYFGVTSKVTNYAGEYVGDAGFEIYPVGVKSNYGNVNKIRIIRMGGFSVDGGFQKN